MCEGSIVGISNDLFDPPADAEFLHGAMKGIGTDDKKLRLLLTSRTNSQRQLMAAAYEEIYGKSLVRRIQSETGGKYERLLVALMIPPADYDAYYLCKAMDGVGTTESLLSEIICTHSGSELSAIREAFYAQTQRSLIDRIVGETSKDYKKYLVSCLENMRSDSGSDEETATQDAEDLYKAGVGKIFGTNENKFIEIFSSRSFEQISLISIMYEQQHGKTLRLAVQNELSGHFEAAILDTLDYAVDPVKYWSKKFVKCMKGFGTDDETLIRLIVTRSERDLKTIRDGFGENFGGGLSLESWIESDTSGNYRKTLKAILMADTREPIVTVNGVSDSDQEPEFFDEKEQLPYRGCLMEYPSSCFTATSCHDGYHGPENAPIGRPHMSGRSHAWCAHMGSDDLPHSLTVNLLRPRAVVGVAIQGRGDFDQRVTRFGVSVSENGEDWDDAGEYDGNTDTDSIVQALFESKMTCSYVKFSIIEFESHPSMRCDVLIAENEPSLFSLSYGCAANLPNEAFTASSCYGNETTAIGAPIGREPIEGHSQAWCANNESDELPHSLTINLMDERIVTGVAIQGRGDCDQWVTKYRVLVSMDGEEWVFVGEFDGCFDRHSIIKSRLPQPMSCLYVKFVVIGYEFYPSLRCDVLVYNQ